MGTETLSRGPETMGREPRQKEERRKQESASKSVKWMTASDVYEGRLNGEWIK